MILQKRIFILLGMLAIFQAAPLVAGSGAMAQQTLRIAAVVNDEAISMADVEDRMKLIMISSGLPNNAEIRTRIMPQVVESLIEEQLKMQEAGRNNIKVTEADIEGGFEIIAQQNNFTVEQFKGLLKKQGIPLKTLERQIRAQLAWTGMIKNVFRRRVNVSPSDISTRTERLKNQLGKTEYLVAEIFLPLDPKRAGEQQQFAQRMATELQAKKAPFGPVAAQFSKAAGAEKGGVIGWVQAGQLEPALDKVLLSMKEGDVSNPIKTTGGLYILQLQKMRTLTEESIPSQDDLANLIGMERMDRIQQKALLDLKSSAFIDRRV